jgi:hypothetical protein
MRPITPLIAQASLGAALVILLQAQASGLPINVTMSGGAPVAAAPKSDLGNWNDATVFDWLVSDVANYETLNGVDLPTVTDIGNQMGLTSGAGGNSITLDLIPPPYNYLVLRWQGQQGGWAQAYFIDNHLGELTFDNGEIPGAGKLLSYSLISDAPVPDGGITLVLLGAAVSGLGLLRRKLR